MFFSTNGISIFVKKNFRKATPGKPTIFLLHGFGGSTAEWKEIISYLNSKYQIIAIDLPGFGKSGKPQTEVYYKTEFLVQLLDTIFDGLGIDNIILLGYSMGGRLALQFAEKLPQKINALILESSSPGIKTFSDQQLRKKNDEELILFIKNNSLKDFFTFWQNQALFASQKNLPLKKLSAIHKSRIQSNSKRGLINSLRNFGQGEMESLWKKLPKINIPTLLLSGDLDSKYTSIQNEMNRLLPLSSHKIIYGAGHNLHLEKPQVFVNLVEEFLQTLK